MPALQILETDSDHLLACLSDSLKLLGYTASSFTKGASAALREDQETPRHIPCIDIP
jgi:hypothetical protein